MGKYKFIKIFPFIFTSREADQGWFDSDPDLPNCLFMFRPSGEQAPAAAEDEGSDIEIVLVSGTGTLS